MRAGCVIALACLLTAPVAAAEQEFPYRAYVASDEVAIRSGPGRNYYTTEKLPLGETVEVYRHEMDWCAIRPPLASFSWMRADDLRIGRNGIGIVLTEGAASRVGASTSDLRDVIQVRLERGEEVEVLDAVQVSNDNGVEFYCKIAPPSGEFRWIHKDDISREQPTGERAETYDVGRPRRRILDSREDDERDAPIDRWGSWVKSRRTDVHQTGGANSVESNSSSDASQSGTRAGRSVALAAAADDDSGVSHAKRDRRKTGASETTLEAELGAIDRELSRIVVEAPAQWDFELLRRRVEVVMGEANDEQVRDAAGDLQERIGRFEDIRQRSLAATSLVAEPDHEDESLHMGESAAADSQARLRHGEFSIGETRPREREYDGIGRLARVVSRRPGAPRYALVNNVNEVVAFVSPGSGVNLQSFEGQHVGISGQRGYMPELKKPHVTALRVSALGGEQSRLARRR